MFSGPTCFTSRASSPLLPTLTSLREVASPDPESDGEVEQGQLAFPIKSLAHPQLQLFETMFNTGKPLSGYFEDDPLWSLLAAYDAALHNCTSSTSTLLELNMLDE
ncbi:hypothetical protein F5877DRAFT_85311 [Lentinula edodes]|nr:hypothetical protein F5877DRAFT_85311 [Lentinula edodes]